MNLEGLGLSEHDKRRIRGDVDYLLSRNCFAHAVPILLRGKLTGAYFEEWPRLACLCPDHIGVGLMMWPEYETHLTQVHPGVLDRPCPACGETEGYWRRDLDMPAFDPDGLQTVVVVEGVITRQVLWYGRITVARPPSICCACGTDVRP